jgi:signal transduction histidine kinase
MIDLTRRKNKKLFIVEVSMRKLINDTIENLKKLDGAYKMTFDLEVEEKYPFFSDETQLGGICENIISNAIMHQHAYETNPALNIQVMVTDTKATLTFRDNGVGIPKEELSRIFDMFFTGEKARGDGSGLGLYVVKEIVKKLKGKIYVDSEVGEGSQFVIEIPNMIDPDFLRKLKRLKNDAD